VNHIQVKEELEECVKKIRNHGKAAGCLIHNRNELQWFTGIGIQFITYLVDNAVLFNDFSNMKKELDKIIE
jgi:2-keto-3-deoxy-L-rhamnonate aldolase RhmA